MEIDSVIVVVFIDVEAFTERIAKPLDITAVDFKVMIRYILENLSLYLKILTDYKYT